MEREKKNLSESVYSRLKNVARERKRPVQEVFKYYAMERFLYRLSVSPHQSSFFLKGDQQQQRAYSICVRSTRKTQKCRQKIAYRKWISRLWMKYCQKK